MFALTLLDQVPHKIQGTVINDVVTTVVYSGMGIDLKDSHNEVSNQMRYLGGANEGSLDPDFVDRLIHILDEHNELVQLFRSARDKCIEVSVPDFKIQLYNMGGVRGYELPTS
ncbi:hypothetical protein Tco_0588217 [Tanacetum coccineum]